MLLVQISLRTKFLERAKWLVAEITLVSEHFIRDMR